MDQTIIQIAAQFAGVVGIIAGTVAGVVVSAAAAWAIWITKKVMTLEVNVQQVIREREREDKLNSQFEQLRKHMQQDRDK